MVAVYNVVNFIRCLLIIVGVINTYLNEERILFQSCNTTHNKI